MALHYLIIGESAGCQRIHLQSGADEDLLELARPARSTR